MIQVANKQPSSNFERDIDLIILGLDTSPAIDGIENSLDIKVVGYREGYALLTVAIPALMLNGFVGLLQGFQQSLKQSLFQLKYRKAESKALDPTDIEERRNRILEHEEKVFSIFDDLLGKNISAKEAVKMTGKKLRDKKYPWSQQDQILDILRTSGRLKGTDYYKRNTK